MVTLFNGLLTAAFAPSAPLMISDKEVVLDFLLTIPGGGGVKIEWYPEFTTGRDVSGQPLPMSSWVWYRETSEEDIGNGDVRMNEVIRRFSPNGSDAVLPVGVHQLDVQLVRTHAFTRVQIRGNTATAQITSPFGKIPIA